MKHGGRRMWALVENELAVALGKPAIPVLRVLLPGMLYAVVAVFWISDQGWRLSAGSSDMASLGNRVLVLLSFAGYAAAILFAPAVAVSGLESDKACGRLDLLTLSPLSQTQVLLALVAGRLLAAFCLFTAAAPLLALPLFLAGSGPLPILVRFVLPAALGALLSVSFALRLATLGKTGGGLWWKQGLFITYTPFAFGFRLGVLMLIARAALPFVLRLAQVPESLADDIALAATHVLFPFTSLALYIEAGKASWPAAGAVAVALLGSALLLRESLGSFPIWMQRREPAAPAESGRRRTGSDGRWRELLGRLDARWESKPVKIENERLPSWTSIAMKNLGPLGRSVLRMTGRNPLVFREIVKRDEGGVLGTGAIVIALVICLALWNAGSTGNPTSRLGAGIIALFFGLHAASRQGLGLLPPRSQGPFMEVLIASPVSGPALTLGGAAVLVWRLAPLLLVLCFVVPVSLVFLLSTVLLFAYSLTAWSVLLLPESLDRISASFVFLPALLLAIAQLHPSGARSIAEAVNDWIGGQVSVANHAAFLAFALHVLGAALLLLIGFAYGFRRLYRFR